MEEEWTPDSKLTFFHHTIAGSVAGLAEHVTIFPIDTLKTHVQCERCGTSSWNCAVKIIRREGILRLWRGVGATFMGCIPAHAAYFSVFESVKQFVGANQEGHQPIGAAISGISASIAHDSIMSPLDTIKQRMQLGYYKNITHCIQTILREEGFLSLYLSFPTTLLMNLPYAGIMVATNESIKKTINPTEKYDLFISLFAGSISGAIAAACTTPLDVIKTKLQTQNLAPCPIDLSVNSKPNIPIIHKTINNNNNNISKESILNTTVTSGVTSKSAHSYHTTTTTTTSVANIASIPNAIPPNTMNSSPISSPTSLSSFSTYSTSKNIKWLNTNLIDFIQQTKSTIVFIYKENGLKGFFKGIGPRMIVHAPSVAISWTVYEGMKDFFLEHS